MPVSYQIDAAAGRVRTRCYGDVTLAEALDHFRALGVDPATPLRPDLLVDLRETNSLPETDQLRSIAKEVARLRAKLQWGACAIVASRDAVFGISRMFAVYTEDFFSAVHVFRELAEAEAWLEERRSPRASAGAE
jgi:hypothetical protein